VEICKTENICVTCVLHFSVTISVASLISPQYTVALFNVRFYINYTTLAHLSYFPTDSNMN